MQGFLWYGFGMDDFVGWLRKQLDEDERIAMAADVKQGDPHWKVSEVMASGGEHFTVRSKRDNRPVARVQRLDGDDPDEPAAILDGAAVSEHIARWDPSRVLAEVAAKRAILGLHGCPEPLLEVCDLCTSEWNVVHMPCQTVRWLAVPYADRPGYDEAWRP